MLKKGFGSKLGKDGERKLFARDIYTHEVRSASKRAERERKKERKKEEEEEGEDGFDDVLFLRHDFVRCCCC